MIGRGRTFWMCWVQTRVTFLESEHSIHYVTVSKTEFAKVCFNWVRQTDEKANGVEERDGERDRHLMMSGCLAPKENCHHLLPGLGFKLSLSLPLSLSPSLTLPPTLSLCISLSHSLSLSLSYSFVPSFFIFVSLFLCLSLSFSFSRSCSFSLWH